eukprot:TRINITY_DN7710_c0_g1_i1.p1 TRINITY_DN7710_c0_g1~~TRINITY_DN7710_c0_g1_i1.p1  ORF type:complete len:288 (+),score=119.60 TRINITY_DN7710_c0_g1_i1:83-865(+)
MSGLGYASQSGYGYASHHSGAPVQQRQPVDQSASGALSDRGSLLGSMDFQPIYDMDPSLADGHREIYNREVPFELRTQESAQKPHDVGTLEGVKVKVLTMGEDGDQLSLRIELSSESDLFFHYGCNLGTAEYEQLREEQKLMCGFRDFAPTLLKMLNKCIKEPQSYLAVLILQRDGNAVLEFIQNMEYKFVELLALPFRESPVHVIHQQISYRYNALKSRLAMMQARLQDVNALVKVKNPSLLLQLQRSAPGQGDPPPMH